MSLILLLVCCMDGKFIAENPSSTLVFYYHAFLNAVRKLRAASIKDRSVTKVVRIIDWLESNCDSKLTLMKHIQVIVLPCSTLVFLICFYVSGIPSLVHQSMDPWAFARFIGRHPTCKLMGGIGYLLFWGMINIGFGSNSTQCTTLQQCLKGAHTWS